MASALGPFSTVALIFGGCCSNVFALEAIIKSEPSSGLLITFFQFAFTAAASYPTQWSIRDPYFIRRPRVPLRRWCFVAAMFFSINMLNNWAFAFSISVPVHIILRSFGSVTTMAAGVIRGKRYSALQVLSVALLTTGVLVSAWADSESKGKNLSTTNHASTGEFTTGLGVLLLAQLLSAFLGAYVEDTYAMYGASWTENLFYTHILGIPLFLPFSGSLRSQYARLAATPALNLRQLSHSSEKYLPNTLLDLARDAAESIPQGVLFLLSNAVTQLACISGVNLLSATSSAVTVTIVLNIRKLVSFIFSTLIFGHELSGKMLLGSALVFGSGALYGLETSWRLPRQRAKKADGYVGNGSLGKKGR